MAQEENPVLNQPAQWNVRGILRNAHTRILDGIINLYIYLLVLEGKRTGMGIINLSFHLKLNDGHLGRLGATLKKYVWWLMFSFHQFVISPDPNSAI